MLRKAFACLVLFVALIAASVSTPVHADHTCFHSCRQQYDQCRATCAPGSCWVCFPNYENCLDYICGG
jgi:hypothetical protein